MATHPSRTIDLATEVGESFALPPAGIPLEQLAGIALHGKRLHPRHTLARQDDVLLPHISTAYVACGAHSGDAVIMGRTVRDLVERGIAIGAHPSYPDIFGFGQESIPLADIELEDVILAQIAALDAIAKRAGSRVSTVKCHGALSFDVADDERTTQIMARAIYRYDPSISLVLMAGRRGANVARDCGIRVVQEAYIDRAYDNTGMIVSRKLSGALITDPRAAASQLMSIIDKQLVRSISGDLVPLQADSFCLHSDTPNSGAIAAAVMAALAEAGIAIAAR